MGSELAQQRWPVVKKRLEFSAPRGKKMSRPLFLRVVGSNTSVGDVHKRVFILSENRGALCLHVCGGVVLVICRSEAHYFLDGQGIEKLMYTRASNVPHVKAA